MGMQTNLVHVRATAAVALSATFTAPGEVELVSVRLHLSAAGGAAENFVVAVDSAVSTDFDVVLSTSAMAAATDVHYAPTVPLYLAKGEQVDFTYANSNLRTYGLEYIYRKLY